MLTEAPKLKIKKALKNSEPRGRQFMEPNRAKKIIIIHIHNIIHINAIVMDKYE